MIENYHTAPIEERTRATLAFLEKLTLRPSEVGSDDVEPLRSLGIRDEAIEDAIQVCTLFSIVDRLADSLGFETLSARGNERAGWFLLQRGYH